jgi:hypothetical protein
MYVIDYPTKWKENVHFVQFAYNNSFQASVNTSPFEVMYNRKWKTPISNDISIERIVFGANTLKEIETIIQKEKENLKIS